MRFVACGPAFSFVYVFSSFFQFTMYSAIYPILYDVLNIFSIYNRITNIRTECVTWNIFLWLIYQPITYVYRTYIYVYVICFIWESHVATWGQHQRHRHGHCSLFLAWILSIYILYIFSNIQVKFKMLNDSRNGRFVE